MEKKHWEYIYDYQCSNKMPSVLPAVKRIIVIGDLHGDWDITIKSLKLAKVIDNNNNWNGGETVVVQLGDQIDRCRSSGRRCIFPEETPNDEASDMKILMFFTQLHEQAQKVGGAVYSILGNHELMNVDGNMNYVSYLNIKDFENFHTPEGKSIANSLDARKWAFRPGNPVANFLSCTRQLSLVIGSNIFVHAGILEKIAKEYKIEDMNKIMTLYLQKKLKNPLKYNDLLESSDYSPLWNRIFATQLPSQQLCDNLMNPLKQYYKVDRIFVGHTPQMQSGISNSCEGKIWLTDYGASKAFDAFDTNFVIKNERAPIRNVQVLEILNDSQINIIK